MELGRFLHWLDQRAVQFEQRATRLDSLVDAENASSRLRDKALACVEVSRLVQEERENIAKGLW